MSCYIKVCCPHCDSDRITRAGKSASGEQRYRCRASDCPTQTFMLN
ncbi:MAG: transposase, partial [Gammaproteobacteria bacterium]